MREAFYESTRAASVISMPVFVGVSMVAPFAVPLVFGEQYAQSGRILQVLALIGVVHGVSYFNYAVFTGIGRPDFVLKLLTVRTIANVVAFFLAVPYGLVAVAAAFVARAYLLMPLNVFVLRIAIEVSPRRYFRNFVPALVASFVMALAIWALSQLPLGELSRLLVSIGLGGIVYLATLQWVAPALVRDLLAKLSLLVRSKAS
jgi:PST family polysaccharide transporter